MSSGAAILAHEPVELADLPQHEVRGTRRLDVLLVCDDRHPANVVRDHIEAFRLYSRHAIHTYNPLRERFGLIDYIGNFDAVIVHYSILAIREEFLPRPDAERIRRFDGLKLQFIQDEYRWIDRITDMTVRLGIHVLFSALRPPNIRKVYHRSELAGVLKFGTLSGYVPDNLLGLPLPPIRERPLHITYRAREIPYWLGRLGHQKRHLAEAFPVVAARHGLRYDISGREADRVYGHDWIAFLCSSKAVLGTEGGSSIFDFDGEVERSATEYLARNPGAGFDAVFRDVLASFDGKIVHRALTPRIFEAAALKCALVLTRGEYAGVLEPWRHYIPLEPDFSNADDVARLLKDDDRLQEMADRAYDEIVASGRYGMRQFVAGVDRAIALAQRRFSGASWAGPHPPAARRPAWKTPVPILRCAIAWRFVRYRFSRPVLQKAWANFVYHLATSRPHRAYQRLKAACLRAWR